ncbi:MAG: A24 family peptidase [Bacillota bacterium]|nr:A24 family peptidase [Bacillota bacterium]
MENRENKPQGRYGLKKLEYVVSGMASAVVTAAGMVAAADGGTVAGAVAAVGEGAATGAVTAGYLSFQYVLVFAAVWLLLIMAITDVKYMIIPDRWVMALGTVALASVIASEVLQHVAVAPGAAAGGDPDSISLMERIAGLFIVSAPMALINLVAGDCFGGGDIKLTAVCGVLMGWRRLVSVMIVVLLASGIFAAGFMALQHIKKKNRKQYFAFGPFICAGVILNIVFPGWGIWGFSLL